MSGNANPKGGRWRLKRRSPDRGKTVYMRDGRGFITQRTDARGVVTNYTYDAAGRLAGKSCAGQTQYWQSYVWDQWSACN